MQKRSNPLKLKKPNKKGGKFNRRNSCSLEELDSNSPPDPILRYKKITSAPADIRRSRSDYDLTKFRDDSADYDSDNLPDACSAATQTETQVLTHAFRPSLLKLTKKAIVTSFFFMLFLMIALHLMYLPSFISGFLFGIGLCFAVLTSIVYVFASYTFTHPRIEEDTQFIDLPDVLGKKKYNTWVKIAVNDPTFVKPFPVFMSLIEGYASFYYPGKMMKSRKYMNMIAVRTLHLGGADLNLPPNLPRWKYWLADYPIQIKDYIMVEKNILETVTNSSRTEFNFKHFFDEDWNSLHVFFETCPEKEMWYYRLALGCRLEKIDPQNQQLLKTLHVRTISGKDDSAQRNRRRLYKVPKPNRNQNEVPAEKFVGPSLPPDMEFVNAFFNLISTDFTKSLFWKTVLARVIERKVMATNVPFFVDGVKITSLDFGLNQPLIKNVGRGVMNPGEGLTMYVDLDYAGGFKLLCTTKINVIKILKYSEYYRFNQTENDDDKDEEIIKNEIEALMKDSLSEDSAHSYRSNRFYSLVAKVVNVTALKKLSSQSSPMVSMIQRFSNTPMSVQVIIERLAGTMVLNIPGPPSDRIWFAFTRKPVVNLSVRPQIGSTWLNIDFICDSLIHVLKNEIATQMVLPNMDNIFIPTFIDRTRQAEKRERNNNVDLHNTGDFFGLSGQLFCDEDVEKLVDAIMA